MMELLQWVNAGSSPDGSGGFVAGAFLVVVVVVGAVVVVGRVVVTKNCFLMKQVWYIPKYCC